MNKLTAEVARQDLNHLKSWVETCGISMKEERYMQALEIALPLLEQQERACQKCGGAGDVDSGAHTAGGRKVMVKCDCQFEQQERGEGTGNLKHVGYLFVNSGGGVVYSPSGYGMRGFTCAGKIYGDVNLQQDPVEGEWIEWGGGLDPADQYVEVKFRTGSTDRDYVRRFMWQHEGDQYDIIAYRIIPEQPTNQNGEQ